MNTVNIYLNFLGNCEEAFLFYQSVFGNEFSYLGRFSDMPKQKNIAGIPEEMENLIMHVSLPISDETILMGSDVFEHDNHSFIQGNNFSISVTVDSTAEADRIFNALSAGGQIKEPMNHAFWGDYFGALTDKFGIAWMIFFSDLKKRPNS